MSSGKRRLIPSPALVVAIVALIAALAGSAVALKGQNTVKSNDIANNAVKTSKINKDAVTGAKIKNATITAPDLDVYRDSFVPAVVSTASGPPVDLGGPAVTVTVPEGGLVGVYARVEALSTGGGGDGAAQVHLVEPTFLPDAPRIMSFPTNNPIAARFTSPGPDGINGVVGPTRAGMITLAPPPGTYTFSLQYSGAGGSTAAFQNRRLWVGIVN